MNDYSAYNSFSTKGGNSVLPFSFARTTDEVDNPWGISSYGEILGILRSNFWPFNLCDTIQHMNIVVQLAHYKC